MATTNTYPTTYSTYQVQSVENAGFETPTLEDGSQVYIDNAGFELPILPEDTYTNFSQSSNPGLGWSI